MSHASRLRLEDIRAVFRLIGEVAELRLQPEHQRAHLAEGIVALIDAQFGSFIQFDRFAPTGPVQVVNMHLGGHIPEQLMVVMEHWSSVVGSYDLREDPTIDRFTKIEGVLERPMSRLRRELMSREAWEASSAYQEMAVLVDIDDLIAATFPCSEDGRVIGMTAQRLESQPQFTEREKAVCSLLNEEAMHLYRQGKLTGAGTIERKLSPRQVQLLRMLLLGKTPKRIAYELGLSVNTVRTYIRDLYRCVGVNGREELMAKYIREGGLA